MSPLSKSADWGESADLDKVEKPVPVCRKLRPESRGGAINVEIMGFTPAGKPLIRVN